jgi:site-specific DNA recombinase
VILYYVLTYRRRLTCFAPDLVKAAIEGRLPRGMGVARLVDMPAEWSRQRQIVGLPAQ